MPENLPSVGVTRLISLAVNFAIVGLVYLLLFLWHGLGAWSMGLGMFVGMPLLLIALLLYVVAVARDMKRRGAL
ncbi:MAG: hypothetical protein OEY80_08485 [Nitrospirota bacterium]|jgi:hypothetical protein|nr:hypothetical protein [Nitrospirota bacterium]MDH4361719.1 hypothetical protein [Nitrospirota bacterium]MDH5295680.1 hypothetical protein [Nitrospirota bacterium]MDH5575503.1 hypothetical protein [Nitrospirota bacterium]